MITFDNIEFIEKYKPTYKPMPAKEEYHSIEHALIGLVIHDTQLDFGLLTEKNIFNFQMEIKNRLQILNINIKSLVFKEWEDETEQFKKIKCLVGFLFPTRGAGGFYEVLFDTNIPRNENGK